MALVGAVGEEDMTSMIVDTFSIIAQNWASFSPETQAFAHDTLADLHKKHNSTIRDNIQMIPSLTGIELLQKFDTEINRFKSAIDPLLRIEAFCQRCQEESSDLVRQSLQELVPFLNVSQRLLQESAISQQPSPAISQLYRALLEASIRFQETHSDILDLCGQCLGILGSIDPNKIEATREKRELVMLGNFDQLDEVIDFVAYMLEVVLVPAFHAASSGKTQSYLAYAMQELLKYCSFRQAVLSRQRSSEADAAHRRWIEIPETVRLTLTPYLTSKYFVTNPSTSGQSKFPIFKPQLAHGSWLRSVVFSLLLRANGDNPKLIFSALARVILGHDVTISASLLPFVIQNVVLGGTEEDFADVLEELRAVLLSYDISLLGHDEVSNIKQCSEVITIPISFSRHADQHRTYSKSWTTSQDCSKKNAGLCATSLLEDKELVYLQTSTKSEKSCKSANLNNCSPVFQQMDFQVELCNVGHMQELYFTGSNTFENWNPKTRPPKNISKSMQSTGSCRISTHTLKSQTVLRASLLNCTSSTQNNKY